MTSKERAKLRSMASVIEPIFQIGKGDISDNQLKSMDEALNKRELIKITVLKNSAVSAKEAAEFISQKLNAQTVAVTGFKIVLYRYSKDKSVKHIEL